jgi:fructosamine-3-kinase
MTELFGGFHPRFYDAYRSARAPYPGYRQRRDVYNLYHLINHLNHFGSSYAAPVAGILSRH